MEDLSHAGMAGIFLRMPHVMWWLMHNANVLPTRAWRILDEAGLLDRRRGEGGKSEAQGLSSILHANKLLS